MEDFYLYCNFQPTSRCCYFYPHKNGQTFFYLLHFATKKLYYFLGFSIIVAVIFSQPCLGYIFVEYMVATRYEGYLCKQVFLRASSKLISKQATLEKLRKSFYPVISPLVTWNNLQDLLQFSTFAAWATDSSIVKLILKYLTAYVDVWKKGINPSQQLLLVIFNTSWKKSDLGNNLTFQKRGYI